VALEGNLRDFNLLEVIQLLGQQGKSGVLRVWDTTSVERQIFLFGGRISHATSTRREGRDLLGERLVKTGIVSRKDFEKVLSIQKDTSYHIGELLVDRGLADEESVMNALYTQIHEIIYEVFKLSEGHFKFDILPQSEFPKIAVALSSEEVMLNILRMVDEWPEIEKRVAPPHVVLEHSGALEELGLELPEDHETVYRLVDGVRNVREIGELSVLGKFATLEVLADLLESGYVRRRPGAGPTIAPSVRSALTTERPRRVPPIGGLIATLVGTVLIALWILQFDLGHFFADVQSDAYSPTTYRERVIREKIALGTRIFYLETGANPQVPGDLVQAGILSETEVE
jgi:hypothetical protein